MRKYLVTYSYENGFGNAEIEVNGFGFHWKTIKNIEKKLTKGDIKGVIILNILRLRRW